MNLQSIEAFLKAELNKITAGLAAVWAKIEPMVEASEQEVAQVALQAVLDQIPLVASGAEKLNTAVSQVLAKLGAENKSVLVAVATAAVQAAYNLLAAGAKPSA